MERPPMKIVQPLAYMDTPWRSMWYRLVLAYQPVVRESCDDKALGCLVKLRWLNCGKVWVKL
jgi:hypothetical protein